MKHWRLGLDVGTASVGAVAIELDADGYEIAIPWHHVRIFSEPNEKGQTGLTPKKAARRQARQQRRQLERRARRVRKIAHLAPLLGLDPKLLLPDGRKGHDLPELRARAAREKVELADLLHILLRMAKRRGYAGGFRATKDDAELGAVQSGSGALQSLMETMAEDRGLPSVTLGEFLADRIRRGLPARLKTDRENVPNLYALRSMLEAEFDQIWSKQEKFHKVLQTERNGQPVREIFRQALFYQRPLKSPAASVGLCPLEKHLPRAPRSQMSAQEFRIEKTLADLRWGAGRLAMALTAEQRDAIRSALNEPGSLTKKEGQITFKRLYKILDVAGCSRPDGRSLNIDRSSREVLKGNTTLKAFEELGLLDEWRSLAERHQVAVINLLADLGSPQQLDADDWHQKFLKAGAQPNEKDRFRRFSPEVVSFINRLRNCDGYGRLTTMGFEGGRMAYSVKALKRLTGWLRDPWWQKEPGSSAHIDEEAAIRECYPESVNSGKSVGQLIRPPLTGNDTVDVALSQVHWVIDEALRTLGSPPQEIILEFGREVGLSPGRRNEWEKISAKNQRLRTQARKEIVESGATGSNTAIRRYLLWQEQSTYCPYCERPLSLAEALDGHQSHVDHIIPRSLTRVGKKRSEIVITHAACNNLKGDRTPWQAFGHDTARWAVIEERAKNLEKKKQFRKAKLLLLKDFEEEVLNDKSIAEFVDRQLHQTSWIARSACNWLQQLCPNVFAARGEFTALLRRSWHLDTVIPEIRLESGLTVLDTEGNPVGSGEFEQYRSAWEGHGRAPARILEKRLDHRHHVIDALVIGLASRSLYQRLAGNYKRELGEMRSGRSRRHEWQVEPPIPGIRKLAADLIRSCHLTHKPDRFSAGSMFQDTAYSLHLDNKNNSAHLTVRKPLSDLVEEGSTESTRKEIECIASPEVRNLVLAEFNRRVSEGESPKQALSRPVDYPQYQTKIYRVRVARPDASPNSAREVRFSSRQGEHVKLLLPDGNAYLEVRGTGRTVSVHVVAIADAARNPVNDQPGEVRRFFKGDTVTDAKDGAVLVVKQIKAAAGGKLILTPVFETRPVRDLKASDGLKAVSGAGLDRLVLTNVFTPGTSSGGLPSPRH